MRGLTAKKSATVFRVLGIKEHKQQCRMKGYTLLVRRVKLGL